MTKDLTKGFPAKLIVSFTIPLLIGNIFQQFYSMADTLIVGRTIGVDALAGVGSTGSLSFLILGFAIGVTTGLSIIIAQRFGAKDEKGLRRSYATCLVISLVLGVVLTVLAVVFSRQILVLMQTPEEIIDHAYAYIIVIFAGTIANIMFNLFSNVIRALGDSKTPLYFLIFACILNIGLDFLFILFFHMGVAGAGFATIISQALSALLCLQYIKKKLPILKLTREDFRITGWDVKQHARVAFPMGFQMSIIAIGAVLLQFVLNGLGATAVAGFTAAQKVDQVATLPMNSFGATMSTYAAQNYGAGKIDRIKKGVFQCTLISLSFSIVTGAINFFFGHNLAGFFVSENAGQVLSYAQTYLQINGAMYWALALLFIYRFTLQGLGESVIPTVAGIMELIMRAGAALFLVAPLGFTGVSMASPLAWVGASIPLAIGYFMTIKRLETNQKNRQNKEQ
ncbi:putative MATE family efflux protein [Lachnospiraceae bacterium PM6-15]|uniref:MATE family efflux transporter n=1 Tax=Ohessyouella blattaphilus TaxID=2949333 RepID=UPI003E27B5E0